jgi:fatty acid desaturase
LSSGVVLAFILVCHGVLLVFLFAPAHETIHKTAFDSQWLNASVAWVCGLILLLPPRYFRAFHMAHHRHTQIRGKDPELVTDKPSSVSRYVWQVSGIPYWYAQVVSIARSAVGKTDDLFVSRSKRSGIINEARLFAIIYLGCLIVSLVSASTVLVWFWLVPVILGQPFLRLFLLAEHTLCPYVPDMFDNTRTTITNSAMRFLCWNMSYHTEHHVHAGIPFHRLPAANRLLDQQLINKASGYFSVNCAILKKILDRKDIHVH